MLGTFTFPKAERCAHTWKNTPEHFALAKRYCSKGYLIYRYRLQVDCCVVELFVSVALAYWLSPTVSLETNIFVSISLPYLSKTSHSVSSFIQNSLTDRLVVQIDIRMNS